MKSMTQEQEIEQTEDKNDGTEQNYTPADVVEWVRIWLTHPHRDRSKFTDIVMVVLTVLIFAAAFWSALIFDGQLSEARKATVLSQRAWIGVSQSVELDTLHLDSTPEQTKFIIPIHNYGNSVALHIAIEARVVVTVGEIIPTLVSNCEKAQSESGANIQLAGTGYNENAAGDSLFPSQEENRHFFQNQIDASRWTTANGGVFVVGCIFYDDQFGKQHRTRLVYGAIGEDPKMVKLPGVLYQFVGFNDAN
jgi:hypothetical protein